MKRVAIYARFSSDLQDARSIGDQVAICCDYAQRQGYTVVRVYEDAAASGSSLRGRAGITRLLADAEAKTFQVLIAESMSRIGRDQEDRAYVRKRLNFFGILIETPSEGTVTPLIDGVRAALDSEYLEDLKRHTRRGMTGRIRDGLSAGGLTYGYAPAGKKGERLIVEHEAAVVRRIFEEYAAGRSPRAIAEGLNADDVRPPRGRDWQASTINGNSVRGSGILMNALYDGRLIWNRVSMHKDPDTGRRVSRPNPETEWIIKAVPHLRIVEGKLFAEVQAIKTARGKQRPEKAHRPKHLLAGLLRCGCCGSAMAVNNVKTDSRRIYCGRRKEGGRCANGKTYRLERIESRVVTALKSHLADPRAIERYLVTYQAERKRLAKEGAGKRAALERTLAQAKREIERVVDAIAMGTISDEDARKRLVEPRRRREAAEAELAALTPPLKVTELHPAAVTRYLSAVEDLAATLSRRMVKGDEDVASALRELIAAVIVHPAEKDEPRIEVRGRLAQLTGAPELFPQQEIPRTVVAGARYRLKEQSKIGRFTLVATRI
jgi:DNA invertase Pin-like site-specific DNA recombinase